MGADRPVAAGSETGHGCRPAGDNRRFFDGMMWMARTVAQWRYHRWVEQGVFDALLKTLAEVVGRDRSADMIDSTVVRAHHCAAGIKKMLGRPRRAASDPGRPREVKPRQPRSERLQAP